MEIFNNMIRRLQDFAITNSLNSSSQNAIANMLLTFLFEEDVQTYTLEEIAEYCNASTATFSRFIRELGYDSFKEFKQLAVAFQSEPVETFSDNDFVLEEYQQEVTQSILETSNLLHDLDLSPLIHAICDTKPVYFLGIHYTEMLLKELQYNLLKIKKQVHWAEGYVNQMEMLNNIKKDSSCVFFSFSGRFIQNVIPHLFKLKDQTTTYLITSKNNQLFESFFDHTIYIGEDSLTGHKQYQLQFFVDVLLERIKKYLNEK